MRSINRLLAVMAVALTMTACASSAPRGSGLQKPLPAASLQLCPAPGPAPGNNVDDTAAALFDLYGLYGQCAGLHADLVRAVEGGR